MALIIFLPQFPPLVLMYPLPKPDWVTCSSPDKRCPLLAQHLSHTGLPAGVPLPLFKSGLVPNSSFQRGLERQVAYWPKLMWTRTTFKTACALLHILSDDLIHMTPNPAQINASWLWTHTFIFRHDVLKTELIFLLQGAVPVIINFPQSHNTFCLALYTTCIHVLVSPLSLLDYISWRSGTVSYLYA